MISREKNFIVKRKFQAYFITLSHQYLPGLTAKLSSEESARRAAEKVISETQKLLETERKEKSDFSEKLEAQKNAMGSLQKLHEEERASHSQQVASILATENTNKSELQQQLDKTVSEKLATESKLREEVHVTRQLTAERDTLIQHLEAEKAVRMQKILLREREKSVSQYVAKHFFLFLSTKSSASNFFRATPSILKNRTLRLNPNKTVTMR